MLAPLLAGLIAFSAGSAAAQSPVDDPTVVAAEASEVRDRYCSDASDEAITLQAEGTARVSAVWARVSRAYDADPAVYLLYWRALLGQCIDKMDRVQEDLEAFLAAVADDPGYSEQVRDARRRLRRIQVAEASEGGTTDPRPGIGVGIGVAAAGGVLGALAGWQGQELETLSEQWHSGALLKEDYEGVGAAATTAAAAANGLTAAAVGAGAAGLTVLIVSAGITADQAAVTAVVVPTPGGLALAMGGRW